MTIIQNIFSVKNKKEQNGKIYKVLTIFGIKIKFLNQKRILSEMTKEIKLLRTIVEKSIDITKVPKATGCFRKVQLIKTKLLEIIDITLKKHNIQYWLEYGSLIGAIRHKGFIPWDDDIDLGIFREDYLNLPELFTKELGDKGFTYKYGLESGSELIRISYKSFDVDFFPMEYINKKCGTEEEKEIFVEKWLRIKQKLLDKHPLNDFKTGKINHIELIPEAEILKKEIIDKNYTEDKKTEQFIRSVETMTATNKCAVFDNEYVFPLQTIPFENINMPAPKDPLMHLCQAKEYGEYGAVMNFPTIKDSGFSHTQAQYFYNIDYDKILEELTVICEKISNAN